MRMVAVFFLIVGSVVVSTALVVASAPQWVVTTSQANQAFDYALEYVKHEVAYQFGGRLTVEEYQRSLAHGKTPGLDIGVDSSAVVVNAYRSVLPDIRFWTDASRRYAVRDANSASLYHANTRPLAADELTRGDVLFFRNTEGVIIGVGMYSHTSDDSVHFIVASANAEQVILTSLNTQGDYWRTSFAGFGRLQYTLAP